MFWFVFSLLFFFLLFNTSVLYKETRTQKVSHKLTTFFFLLKNEPAWLWPEKFDSNTKNILPTHIYWQNNHANPEKKKKKKKRKKRGNKTKKKKKKETYTHTRAVFHADFVSSFGVSFNPNPLLDTAHLWPSAFPLPCWPGHYVTPRLPPDADSRVPATVTRNVRNCLESWRSRRQTSLPCPLCSLPASTLARKHEPRVSRAWVVFTEKDSQLSEKHTADLPDNNYVAKKVKKRRKEKKSWKTSVSPAQRRGLTSGLGAIWRRCDAARGWLIFNAKPIAKVT